MIKTEFLNDGTLIKHFSDEGFMLLQVETGIKYADPIDVVPCRFTYEETDELIQEDNAEEGPGGPPVEIPEEPMEIPEEINELLESEIQ